LDQDLQGFDKDLTSIYRIYGFMAKPWPCHRINTTDFGADFEALISDFDT
jgi:hypothetical protein